MHLSLLQVCLRYFSNTESSRVDSERPLRLSSEFPRNFCISVVLVLFLLVLFCLAGEITYLLFQSIMQSGPTFSFSSFLYFLAYVLANILFLTHLSLYFGYREEISLGSESFDVSHAFFGVRRYRCIPIEKILYFQMKQNLLGNYHVELFYFADDGKTKKIYIGTYLGDEHISLLSAHLRRFEI
ncbi:hypothetical protein HOF92_00775 [bacterium]|nr:hypothetical protein [bacterium]